MTASRGVLATVMAGLVLLAGVGTGPAIAGAAGTLLGTWQNWEARQYDDVDGDRRCVARAFHPSILEGEILWVIDTARPSGGTGYLAVDSRLVGGADTVRIAIDTGQTIDLLKGRDGWFYSPPSRIESLRQALRTGLEATLVMEGGDRGNARVTVPLTGFTRASDAAARACGREAEGS